MYVCMCVYVHMYTFKFNRINGFLRIKRICPLVAATVDVELDVSDEAIKIL